MSETTTRTADAQPATTPDPAPNENFALARRRWPWFAAWVEAAPPPADAALLADLPAQPLRIDGVQLAGGHQPRLEAGLQATLVPAGSRTATVYGLAEGWLVRSLLERPEIESVRVCPLSASVARVVLEHLPTTDVLGDPRVELVDPRAETELSLPFAAAPAELVLADTDGARVRDLVALEFAMPFLRERRAGQEREITARIEGNRAHLAEDGDVARFDGAWRGARVHVAGAGPSLCATAAALSERPEDEPLIACDGALRTLVAAGATPDVVLAMDLDREALLGLLDVPAEVSAGITLVYDPCAHADAIGRWAGPRIATYGSHPAYDALAAEQPRERLWSAGSVLHAAVDLARRGGAASIVLHGADFATPGGKSHADGFAWQKDLPDRGPHGAWVEGQGGERLRSLPNLVGYLRDLERYVTRHPEVRFVDASGGARIAGTHREEGTR